MRGKFIMKLFVILVLWQCANTVAGQVLNGDSVHNLQVAENLKQSGDSLSEGYEAQLSKLDSLKSPLRQMSIVYALNQKVDSIQSRYQQRVDSLMNRYKKKLSDLDSSQTFLQNRLDSLKKSKLPTDKISTKLDSLTALRRNVNTNVERKLQTIKDQTSLKLGELDLPPEVREKANVITKKMDEFKIPTSAYRVPTLNVPSNPLENVGSRSTNDLINPTNSLPSSGVEDVKPPDGIKEMQKLPDAQGNIDDMSAASDKVREYSKEAEGIIEGDPNATKNISEAAEEKAAQVSGIKEVEEEVSGLDEYKTMTTKAQNPNALKKEAIDQAKKVAINHFAGKEELLKEAMNKISKYKQKYSSLAGLKDLSKRRPNEMRNKPTIERIVPGIAIQLQNKGDYLSVDFNPYAGYRFTGKLRAGLGWNQRIGYNTKYYGFSPGTRIYGPRVFGEYKLGKGFSPRVEIELMNTGIPPLPVTTYDPEKRDWVWGAFVGLKKEYKFIRNVKGTAMIMTRLFNPQHKSPYADLLNVRFGFEFPMKGRVSDKK